MNLKEAIRLLIKEQGRDVVNSPAFLGMLDDYGAFREEEPATRTIVRELVRTGQGQRLIDSPNKGRNLHFEIRTVVSETARSGGFREDLVSVTLMEIALGAGKIQKVQDWPTITEEKPDENGKPSKPSVKVPLQGVTTTATSAKSSVRPSFWKRVGKWFTRHLGDLLFWAFIICVLLAVVTLIQTIYWLVVGPPDVAEAKAWEFLVCTICAVVMWFVNGG